MISVIQHPGFDSRISTGNTRAKLGTLHSSDRWSQSGKLLRDQSGRARISRCIHEHLVKFSFIKKKMVHLDGDTPCLYEELLVLIRKLIPST